MANLSLDTEPVAIMAAVNAAITSTLGILTLTEVLAPEVAGAIGTALGAWILVGSLVFVRSRTTAPLTVANLSAELAEAKAKAAEPA